MESRNKALRIPDLETRWKLVVSFMLQQLYTDAHLTGDGRHVLAERNTSAYAGNRPPAIQPFYCLTISYKPTTKYFFPWLNSPWRTLAASHIGGFLSYLDRRQDSLDEWSARRKASAYAGQHNTERREQTSMPWAGFELTIPATNRPRPTSQTVRPLWSILQSMSYVKLCKESTYLHTCS
jgi:hypothetical protein